jgi:poly(3-hydroxybutyrate) depolymerase
MNYRVRHILAALVSAATLATSALPVSADLWWAETLMNRDIVGYDPEDAEDAVVPLVVVFHDEIKDGQEMVTNLPVYDAASKLNFRVIYVPQPRRDGVTVRGAEDFGILPDVMRMTTSEGLVSENGIIFVGYGEMARKIVDYACSDPANLAGVVAIDYPLEQMSCDTPTALNAMVLHDTKSVRIGTDLLSADLRRLISEGARIINVPLSDNPRTEYPNMTVQFHDQSGGKRLEDVIGLFVASVSKQ